jgi:hypothetical protein
MIAAQLEPPLVKTAALNAERLRAIEYFRTERLEEPSKRYLSAFDDYRNHVARLFEATLDLTTVEKAALDLLTDPKLLEAFRYLAAPPISLDDLKTLINTPRLSPAALEKDPALKRLVVDTVRSVLDSRRFPWVDAKRTPTEAERHAAIVASAALLASSRVATDRRNMSKAIQEQRVKDVLKNVGFKETRARRIANISAAPGTGEFCGESKFGSRKADLVVRLHDGRVMPIECKVSNSELNSVKRLNNDAAVKAEVWKDEFGRRQVVPTAVLSGVYSLSSLEMAQDKGLTLFWAHDLDALTRWVRKTKQKVGRAN